MKTSKHKHPNRPDYRKLRGEKVVGVSLSESDRALLAVLGKRVGGKKAAVSEALRALHETIATQGQALSNEELLRILAQRLRT